MNTINPDVFTFYKALAKNNTREWFEPQKARFKALEKEVKAFNEGVKSALETTDEIEKVKMFRIYRDVRFSKNKLPYKTHLSTSIHREGKHLRGGYYVHIEPGNSFIACGFWNPNKEDLYRIRKEIESEYVEFSTLLEAKELKKQWGILYGDQLKSCPKGFNKEHVAIKWLRYKQFILKKGFTDKECLAEDFSIKVVDHFRAARPFLDFMTLALTTDLNGESIV